MSTYVQVYSLEQFEVSHSAIFLLHQEHLEQQEHKGYPSHYHELFVVF